MHAAMEAELERVRRVAEAKLGIEAGSKLA